MTELDFSPEIAVFGRERAQLIRKHGLKAWIAIAEGSVRGLFPSFAAAAEFAFQTYPETKCLIRDLDDRRPEFPSFWAEV